MTTTEGKGGAGNGKSRPSSGRTNILRFVIGTVGYDHDRVGCLMEEENNVKSRTRREKVKDSYCELIPTAVYRWEGEHCIRRAVRGPWTLV